jgi:hypothetical protein
MTRIKQAQEITRHWQNRIESDLAPFYAAANQVGKLKIETVIAVITWQISYG